MTAFLPTDKFGVGSKPGIRESITLNLLTPLRLKENGNLVTRLTFALFFERLVQRISLLSTFYGAGVSDLSELSALAGKAGEIDVATHELYWYDWERYSNRQKTTMKFGGLKGMVSFRGELGPFLPYIHIGEHLNVGLNTTFGLGKYEVL
jgi:hypothetical protein